MKMIFPLIVKEDLINNNNSYNSNMSGSNSKNHRKVCYTECQARVLLFETREQNTLKIGHAELVHGV